MQCALCSPTSLPPISWTAHLVSEADVRHGRTHPCDLRVPKIALGPLNDPALVAPRVAIVVGVRETPEQPLATALVNTLRNRKLLLVLDNCEHLLGACAQLVDGLLHSCPDLRVLATSREAIGIGGEVAWRVPSLEVPEEDSAAIPEQLGSR
jgi:predicted ATPase